MRYNFATLLIMVPVDYAGEEEETMTTTMADVWVASLMDNDELRGARRVYVGCKRMAT